MYLCKLGQIPSTCSEVSAQYRSYGDADSDAHMIRNKNFMLGGHKDLENHSGGSTLGPNCFNGNKQTTKVLPEVKDLTYHIILRGSKFWTVLNGPCCDDLRHVVHSNFLRHSLTKSHQAKVDVWFINRHLRSLKKLKATTMI